VTKDAKTEKELLAEIGSLWGQAQKQLEQIKRAVSENQKVQGWKAQLEDTQRERDQKVMALGEAALKLESKSAPVSIQVALESAKAVEARLQKEKSSIKDLLLEADVVGRDLSGKKKPVK
jgi:hypothetical protein